MIDREPAVPAADDATPPRGPTRIHYGPGALERLGEIARSLGARRGLVVSDRGLLATGYPDRAGELLARAGVEPAFFHDFEENPTSLMAARGAETARRAETDLLVGLGGGSSMDCAKAINFLVTNGGTMADYRGYGKARHAMIPMIAVPTTAGTGSEVQSYALISDDATHAKMACGDPKAFFRDAVLDPGLTVSQPRAVTSAAGYDAIGHAVESHVTTRRTTTSQFFSLEAWRLLSASFARVLEAPDDVAARGSMLLGACMAGIAIENSMLGATHALANPLSARFGTVHGVAIALMLPHVVRWNAAVAGALYDDLSAAAPSPDGASLADRLASLAAAAGLPRRLADAGVPEHALPELARAAPREWTGQFNPRPLDEASALALYRAAF